jgi:hypothetical protein
MITGIILITGIITVKTFLNFCPFAGSENIISNIMVCSQPMHFFLSVKCWFRIQEECKFDLQSSFCQKKMRDPFESLDQWPHT